MYQLNSMGSKVAKFDTIGKAIEALHFYQRYGYKGLMIVRFD